MEELVPKPLCRFCDEGTPTHICYTCVDLENETEGTDEGVLICEKCMSSFHCKGMFTTHMTSSLAAIDKTQTMMLEIKEIKKFVCESTTEEILKLNVKRALLKTRNEEAGDVVHSKLMEVWNAFAERLSDKEKKLNSQIQQQVDELCKQSDSLREKMKSIAGKASNDCDTLLTKLSAKNRSISDGDLTEEKELLKQLLEVRKEAEELVKASMQDIGPYVDINLGGLLENCLEWINQIKLTEIKFHHADILQSDGEVTQGLTTPLSEETEYTVPASFLSQAMLNPRQNSLSLPHPTVAQKGYWVRHAMEYYLAQAVEQKILKSIPESELNLYAQNSSVIAVKYREQNKMHRCYITFPHMDARSKARRRKETEVQIHLVDNWDSTSVKTVAINKLIFFNLDHLTQSISTMCLKVVMKMQDDQHDKVVDWTPQIRKKLSKLVDSQQDMRVKLIKPISFQQNQVIFIWLADLVMGDVNLKSLFNDDGEEAEKPKLCQDVRVLRGDNIPIVRATIRPKDETPDESSKAKQDGVSAKSENAPGDVGAKGDAANEVVCGVLVDLSDDLWDAPLNSGTICDSDDKPESGKCCGDAGESLDEIGNCEGSKDATSPHPSVEERKEHIANVQRELKKLMIGKDTSGSDQSLLDGNAQHIKAGMHEFVKALQPPLKPATDCNNNTGEGLQDDDVPGTSRDDAGDAFGLDDELRDLTTADTNSDLDEYAPQPSSLCMMEDNPLGDAPLSGMETRSQTLSPDACQFRMPSHPVMNSCGVPNAPPGLMGVHLTSSSNPGTPTVGHIRTHAETWGHGVQWNAEERRSLRYVTLILFGENSTEFLNSGIIGEPPASIRKYWSGLIREQQWLWSLLPRPLYQQCLDYEILRFPDLCQEFCRFCVPFNVCHLAQRLGPQLPVFLRTLPDLKSALDTISNHCAKSQARQVVAEDDNIVVSVNSSPQQVDVDRSMNTPPEKDNENSFNQSGPSERARQSPVSLPDLGSYSNRKMSTHSNPSNHENVPVILKRSKSVGKIEDCTSIKRTIINDTGTESSSSHTGERECDWVEDENYFPNAVPAVRPEPTTSHSKVRSDRREGRCDQCYNCGALGHIKMNCPHPVRREKSNNNNIQRRTNRYPRGRRLDHGEDRDRRRGRR